MDATNAAFGYGNGPRFALALAVVYYVFGALLLRPVVEPKRSGGSATAAAAA